jgi:hypothetical protein
MSSMSICITGITPDSYEQVGRRIQRIVSNPNVQKVQAVTIFKRDDEPLDAWERVLQEFDETDGITVERLGDGSVRIGWKQFIDM